MPPVCKLRNKGFSNRHSNSSLKRQPPLRVCGQLPSAHLTEPHLPKTAMHDEERGIHACQAVLKHHLVKKE